jgi:MFS superfamily sulfate permease-like transporter
VGVREGVMVAVAGGGVGVLVFTGVLVGVVVGVCVGMGLTTLQLASSRQVRI